MTSFALSRRELLAGVTAAAGCAAGGCAAAGLAAAARAVPAADEPISFEALSARADALAAKPFVPRADAVHAAAAVDYDALNHIAYRADRTVWGTGGTPGVRFFPLNRYANVPVDIAVGANGRFEPFAFRRDLFTGAEHLPAGVEGFSGFRLMNPRGDSDWLAYQGASYFRAAGALDQYGLSARALAIDTGLATPEEFPRFTRFWIEPGREGAVIVFALLDSPRVAGAWMFTNTRTAAGVVQDVRCSFRLRADVARLGVAPLTSMFWYGEGDRARAVDWRPEIHDSDGLALLTGAGERIWRPLTNPPQAITNSFADTDPKGFGLLQRDRTFDHYQDDGVFYDRRPNLWVEPQGRWGKGAVTLFAMPTHGETDDNVVAFWTPAGPARAGMRYQFAYRLRWTATEPQPAAGAIVTDCWRGQAGPAGRDPIPGATRLVADFAGPALAGLTRGQAEAAVTLDRGTPISVAAYPVVGAKERWRLVVDVPVPRGQPVNLRAYLHRGAKALSETLVYQFT